MKAIFLVSESAVFPRLKNLYTEKTSNGSNFGWFIQHMSINRRSGRQTFRRRFVSGSLSLSFRWNVLYKAKRSLSLISGYSLQGLAVPNVEAPGHPGHPPLLSDAVVNPSYVFSVNKEDSINDSTTFRELYNLTLMLQLSIKKSYY